MNAVTMVLFQRMCSVSLRISRRHSTLSLQYVPHCVPATEREIQKLQELLTSTEKLFVLTGAGISTESGIPDYRSEGVGLYARSKRGPITIQQFLKSESARKRYWARNYVGWPRFSSVQPNLSHKILSEWEANGHLSYLVSQNVDALHQKAGSKVVIDLHGTAFRVVCINCKTMMERHLFQKQLQEVNDIVAETVEIRPDGDVDLTQDAVENFTIPPCSNCGGILKPDIVFFGDNVPKQKVEQIYSHVDTSDCLLVLGSSLTVFSSFRFVSRARDKQIPVAIVNIGFTRGDKYADVKIESRCGDVLTKICWK